MHNCNNTRATHRCLITDLVRERKIYFLILEHYFIENISECRILLTGIPLEETCYN